MRLIMIRHGEPDYVHDTLTEKGWREAACLAERIKNWKVTDFYVSPLGRARDTSRPALEALGRSARVLPWLQEYRARIRRPDAVENGEPRLWIPWDLLPGCWTENEALYSKGGWMDTPLMRSGNGDVKAVYEETCQGLDGLLKTYGYEREGNHYRVSAARQERGAAPGSEEDDTVVLFCHFGITCVMLSHLLGIAFPPLVHGLFLAPTSVTVLCTEEREPDTASFRCQMIGDTSHLQAAGEPVSMAGYFAQPFQG